MAPVSLIARQFRERYGVAPRLVASAPARVNLIGEHTDYNDGFVLPMAIDLRLSVAVAGSRLDPESTRCAGDLMEQDKEAHRRGLMFMAGVMWALRRDHPQVHGTDAFVMSDIPAGAGLASSAALEIAYARALCESFGVAWEPMEMAKLAQEGEMHRFGVRCGIMDQAASAAGRRGCVMLMDCRSVEITYVDGPESVSVVVMDTGTRRALSDTAYNERRAACEAAVGHLQASHPGIRALRDVSTDMLTKAASSMDAVTLRRAQHVVAENRRPFEMVKAFRAGDVGTAGQLMNDSHASLRDLYEVSSAQLDIACDLAREHPGCLGARMTGAGFGGCAIALVQNDAIDDFIRYTQPRYEARTYQSSKFYAVRADDGARLEPLQPGRRRQKK